MECFVSRTGKIVALTSQVQKLEDNKHHLSKLMTNKKKKDRKKGKDGRKDNAKKKGPKKKKQTNGCGRRSSPKRENP